MSPTGWRRLRQVVQVVALALFLYLLLGTQRNETTFLPHDLFFRLDPLIGASAMVAGREWMAPLALGALTLLAVFALGNVWCGWLCPMGTLLDWTPLYRLRRSRTHIPRSWRNVKYFVLLTILIAAVLGSLTVLVLDPITMLFRSFASVVLPVLGSLITAIHTALYRVDFLQPAVEWADNAARSFLPLDQSFVLQSLPILLLILGVFALNLVQPRFWCRYLCPLGALMGLASRLSWLRYHVSQADCIACEKCADACPTGAIDSEHQFDADLSDCNQCLECREKCPVGAISFRLHRFQWPKFRWPRLRWPRGWRDEPVFDPSRRRALGLFGAALACALLIRYVPWSRAAPRMAVRPPGAVEAELLSHCVRCGECIKVCPTGGLQPTLFNGGIAGLWTPELVSRVGYCDYQCNACGQVCPSRAIPQLPLEQKQQTAIGRAAIDEQRCLPWTEGTDCIVCWELCPVPQSAIRLVHKRRGGREGVLCPEVIPDRCIGCGVCENKCPVEGEAAIRVYAPGDVDSV